MTAMGKDVVTYSGSSKAGEGQILCADHERYQIACLAKLVVTGGVTIELLYLLRTLLKGRSRATPRLQ
jgi:hypothetical protein